MAGVKKIKQPFQRAAFYAVIQHYRDYRKNRQGLDQAAQKEVDRQDGEHF
jgi:response regulator of citrate/malate metabolism